MKILLVDDDISSITALTNLLKDNNSLRIANNGLDAFELFKANKYDVVITDYAMPKMNGLELLGAIRSRNSHVPVVLVTGHVGSIPDLDAVKESVRAVFFKPLDVGAFLSLLDSIENDYAMLSGKAEGSA